MPQPNEMHERLHAIAGRWEGEETMHPSPWMPDGGVRAATITNRVDMAGFCLIQDYEQRDGETVMFSGHGVFSIDTQSSRTKLYWWDSMGMGPELFEGEWSGETLVLESRNPMGHTRGTWTFEGDRYTHKMEMSRDGTDWTTLMDGRYQRVG